MVVAFASSTFADYADGSRTEQALTLPDAVKVWRQEAWQRDDFVAQVRLGDLYGGNQSFGPGETKNASFIDPVESFVWYYMALRPGRSHRSEDEVGAIRQMFNMRRNALNNGLQTYSMLTFEQRQDARARLLYILSSKGADGFLTLGRIHSAGYFDNNFHPPSPDRFQLMCVRSHWDHWYSGWLWWVVRLFSSEPYPHLPYLKWVDTWLPPASWPDVALDSSLCFGQNTPPFPRDDFDQVGNGGQGGANLQGNNANNAVPLNVGGGNAGAGAGIGNVGAGAGNGNAGLGQAQDDIGQNGDNGPNDGAVGLINAGNGAAGAGNVGGGAPGGQDMGGARFGGFGASPGGRWNLQLQAPVFAPNDGDALTYFLIAQRLGHPLAASYAAAERGSIRYDYNDAPRIIADAEKRSKFWAPPYEYYPGITAKGELHSDESIPSIEERLAQRLLRDPERGRTLPLSAVVEALDFRGYKMLPRLCGPPPICLRRGVEQFQTALNWEPTGFLTPVQSVRLIQMAAVDGDAIAQDRLGIMYAKGVGVPQNFVRAEKWFVKAANQRYPDALFNLSVLYRVGPNGVEPDEHKSDSYRSQAERAGYPMARCELLDLLRLADSAGHDRPEGRRR